MHDVRVHAGSQNVSPMVWKPDHIDNAVQRCQCHVFEEIGEDWDVACATPYDNMADAQERKCFYANTCRDHGVWAELVGPKKMAAISHDPERHELEIEPQGTLIVVKLEVDK